MLRIYVVDDHAVTRRGIVSLIEEQEAWVVCGEASNREDAIAGIAQLRPDIAIVDYRLPPSNGLDVIKDVASNYPDCQILAFTMHDHDELIREMIAARARAVVLKSDPDAALIAAIHSLSQRRRYISGQLSEGLRAHFYLDATNDDDRLTSRELQVVGMIAQGKTNKDIARALDISVKTVDSHRGSAMRKTGAHSTADLTRYAIRHNLAEL